MTDAEIKNFADANHWLDHFPPLAVEDLRSIGLHVSSIILLMNQNKICITSGFFRILHESSW